MTTAAPTLATIDALLRKSAVPRKQSARRAANPSGVNASGKAAGDGTPVQSAEHRRLREDEERTAYWRRWGPYVSARQWGTVREDYSATGEAWNYLPHDAARSRAYRWGEDGIFGICDNHQRLCFAPAFWNGEDPILKERLFGLSGPEGNHGEDVKEYYFYLDNVPTHSYMKALYKYPQRAFPYDDLVRESARRTKEDPEYELLDTGVFADDAYFDVTVEYAKFAPEDIAIAITVVNRGSERRSLYVLPTLWYRNTWSWEPNEKPRLTAERARDGTQTIVANDRELGTRYLYCEPACELLFTENETNTERIYGTPNASPYVKDSIDDYIVHGRRDAVNPAQIGTKASAAYCLTLDAGAKSTIRLRLTPDRIEGDPFGAAFDRLLVQRAHEADEFYAVVNPYGLAEERRHVQRQAFAGMLWTKQFYQYVVREWLEGDPLQPPPPERRWYGRNHNWQQLFSDDILSMPDNWEYPWFASWDLAFHVIVLALIDPVMAKRQLLLLTREWYMHPNGQIPAYEWSFDDVNPPVQAWAALRIFQIEEKMTGRRDHVFLERVFQKLLMNFTWWVNRKDAEGSNVFQGGFLGLDNIGVFDRDAQLPTGGTIDQSDGTSWMGVYSLNMLAIAVVLAQTNIAYEDIASKFFEHFLYIAAAMNSIGDQGYGLWDEEDGFYYDVLRLPDGTHFPMKVRSAVGLIPLMAVQTVDLSVLKKLPDFARRMRWFIENRPDLRENISRLDDQGVAGRRMLSIIWPDKLRRILARMLDESEFLSPYGLRSLSKVHKDNPYTLEAGGTRYVVRYEPAESRSGTFGGNSNWRGPIWFPLNYMIIEALQHYHYFLGDGFLVEFPTGSGNMLTLWEVATELSHRLIDVFDRDGSGRRPVYGGTEKFQRDPHWRDYVLFFEYFNGDDGAGLGASHQTGWTGIVAKLLQQCAEYCGQNRHPLDDPENAQVTTTVGLGGRR
jgi:Glycosyl hydrolase family 63 C-terminal domain